MNKAVYVISWILTTNVQYADVTLNVRWCKLQGHHTWGGMRDEAQFEENCKALTFLQHKFISPIFSKR